MKRFLAVLMVVMMAFLVAAPVLTAVAETEPIQVYVWTDDGQTLNLRDSRSTNSKVLAKLGVGKVLTVLNVYSDGWLRVSVQLDGKKVKGYVMEKFTDEMDPTEKKQTFTTVSKRFKVTVAPSSGDKGKVNLRAKADTTSTIKAYLYKGDVLTVIAESHAYYKVRTAAGKTGYVVKAFVTK